MNDSGVARILTAGTASARERAAFEQARHLLGLRFALFNVVAFGALVATWMQGWLADALQGETLWLCALIGAVFVYGLAACTLRVFSVNRALDDVRRGSPASASHAARYLAAIADRAAEARAMQAQLLRLRLSNAISNVRHVANSLVLLGLVGTVIGFIVALSGVKPELTASVENVAPMVSTLIKGMSIALYTTLIGAVLHVWLMIAYRMLASGSLQLYDAIIDLGERRVGR